jgi:spore maturation protein CgeB
MDDHAQGAVAEGKPVMQSMWACNPRIHKTWDPARPIGVIYAGKDQPDRRPFVEHMLETWPDQDINRIHSDNVPGALPLMEPELYAKMHGSAKVGISLSLNVKGETQPKTRPFEVAGCGAALAISRPHTLAGWFEEGKEYLGFGTVDEMVYVIDGLLRHPGGAEAMATAAQWRAHHEHTYAKRLLEVVKWVM